MDQYQLTTLKNGFRLITVPMPHVESVTVMVGVAAGSRNETKRVNGLFHFIEHMAFKGTKKRPTTLSLTSEMEGVGAQHNASTDKEMTFYWIKLAAEHAELAFDLLSDMLTNSLLAPQEIERERGVIIEEINMYEDTPTYLAEELFVRLLFGDNPMGWDIAGDRKSVNRIKREDFLEFQNKLYFARNMALVVAGKITQTHAEKLAQKYFYSLRKKGQKEIAKIILDQKKAKLELKTKKTEQAHFCLGVPGVSYTHPERFVVGVLASLLGGGMSSRLYQEIRVKRGLAYYVLAQPEFFVDSGYFLARAGVRLDKLEEAVKIVLAEFEKLAIKRVFQKELKKAKEYLKGGLILALEDSYNVAQRYLNQVLLEKKIRTPQEAIELIEAVTAQQVQKTASKLLQPQKLNLAIIGPYKDEAHLKKLLKS